jgi:hypothetical protein
MTSHRESADITAVISALTHTNITTKKAALSTLKTSLDTEQALVDSERDNLHAHRVKVSSMIDNLTSQQDGEEYTVLDSQGVFTAAEKTAILADVAALQAPVAPTVYAPTADNEDTAIAQTDKLVLIKHVQLSGLTATLPSANLVNGQQIVIKNYQIADGSQQGDPSPEYFITVRPASGQSPPHKIDYKFDTLIIGANSIASGDYSSPNESCRLVWLAVDASWIDTADGY